MTIEEAIAEIGSQRDLYKRLKIHRQSITQWKKQGFIPYKHQIKIQELTGGKLTATIDKKELDSV